MHAIAVFAEHFQRFRFHDFHDNDNWHDRGILGADPAGSDLVGVGPSSRCHRRGAVSAAPHRPCTRPRTSAHAGRVRRQR